MEEIIMKKLLSCKFNIDTACVELKYSDGSMLAIDCDAVEDEYAQTIRQRSALDYLVYNAPLEYANLVLCGDVEGYLKNSLPCGRCTITLSNGIIIEGTFHGSELDPKEECTVIDNTGKTLTGHFINKVFVPTNKDADRIDAELVASIIKCWPNIQF